MLSLLLCCLLSKILCSQKYLSNHKYLHTLMKSLITSPLHRVTGKPLPVNSRATAVTTLSEPNHLQSWFLLEALIGHAGVSLTSSLVWWNLELMPLSIPCSIGNAKWRGMHRLLPTWYFSILHRLVGRASEVPNNWQSSQCLLKSFWNRPRNKCLRAPKTQEMIGKYCTIIKATFPLWP